MVKIIGYETRSNKENEPFIVLMLQGDLVMVQSKETGRFYATAKQCSITSTFNEERAKGLIGRDILGQIARVPCEPYEFLIQETGESITLSHRYEFMPENVPAPMYVAVNNVAA